jgi:hypothetical protein
LRDWEAASVATMAVRAAVVNCILAVCVGAGYTLKY